MFIVYTFYININKNKSKINQKNIYINKLILFGLWRKVAIKIFDFLLQYFKTNCFVYIVKSKIVGAIIEMF